MRTHLMFAILVGLLVAASSCNSPSKTPSGQASYRLKCGPKVPPEIARTIESKTYYEGRNELISSPTSRLYAVIAQGELDSMILESRWREANSGCTHAGPAAESDR